MNQFFSSKVKEAVDVVLKKLNTKDFDISALNDRLIDLQYYLDDMRSLKDEGWQDNGVFLTAMRSPAGDFPSLTLPVREAIQRYVEFYLTLRTKHVGLYEGTSISWTHSTPQSDVLLFSFNGRGAFHLESTQFRTGWTIEDGVDWDRVSVFNLWFADYNNPTNTVTVGEALAASLNCLRDSNFVSGMTQYVLGLYQTGRANGQAFAWAFQDQLSSMSDNMRDLYDYFISVLPQTGCIDGLSLLSAVRKLWDFSYVGTGDDDYHYSLTATPVVDCSPLIPTDQLISTVTSVLGTIVAAFKPVVGLAVASVGWVGSKVYALINAEAGNVPQVNLGEFEQSKLFAANVPMLQVPGFPVASLPTGIKDLLVNSSTGGLTIQHPFVVVNVMYDSADESTVAIEAFPGSRLRFSGPTSTSDQSSLYPFSLTDTFWSYTVGDATLEQRFNSIDQDISEGKSVILTEDYYDPDPTNWDSADNAKIWAICMNNMDAFGRLIAPIIAQLQPSPSNVIKFPVSEYENQHPEEALPEHSFQSFSSEPNSPMLEIDFGKLAPLFWWGVMGKYFGTSANFSDAYSTFNNALTIPQLKKRKSWAVIVNSQAARLRNVFCNHDINSVFIPALLTWLVSSPNTFGYDYFTQSACFEVVVPTSAFSLAEKTIITGAVAGAVALIGTTAALKLKRKRRKKLNIRRAQQAEAQRQYQLNPTDANYKAYAKSTRRYNKIVGSMSSSTDVISTPLQELLNYATDDNVVAPLPDSISNVVKLISG